MLQARVATAAEAAARAGGRAPPQGTVTKVGAIHRGRERPRRLPERRPPTQRGPEGDPRARARAPSRCHPRTNRDRGAGLPPRHTGPVAHAREWGRTKGTHPPGQTEAATPPQRRAPAHANTAGTSRKDAGRRAHTHTHHTPTEGVWRAPLPGHLDCDRTR